MGVLTQHMFAAARSPERGAPRRRGSSARSRRSPSSASPRSPRIASRRWMSSSPRIDGVVRLDGERDADLRAAPGVGPRTRRREAFDRRMADELEPPSLAEMRLALDGDRPPRPCPQAGAVALRRVRRGGLAWSGAGVDRRRPAGCASHAVVAAAPDAPRGAAAQPDTPREPRRVSLRAFPTRRRRRPLRLL